MVRMEGLEPPRLSAPEPKSGVSTNFTTSAKMCSKRQEARESDSLALKYQAHPNQVQWSNTYFYSLIISSEVPDYRSVAQMLLKTAWIRILHIHILR